MNTPPEFDPRIKAGAIIRSHQDAPYLITTGGSLFLVISVMERPTAIVNDVRGRWRNIYAADITIDEDKYHEIWRPYLDPVIGYHGKFPGGFFDVDARFFDFVEQRYTCLQAYKSNRTATILLRGD